MSDLKHTTAVQPVSAAYRAGEAAYLNDMISLAAHQLYRHFVFAANERGFCWWGVEKLCQVFKRCARTIGRWIQELVQAGLILREHHRGVAHTYITAIADPQPEQVSFLDDALSDLDRTLIADPSIKEESLNAGGGGADAPGVADATDAATVAELRSAGVVSAHAIRKVASRPLDRVRAVIQYVQSLRRATPGLIVHMLDTDTPIPTTPVERPTRARSAAPVRQVVIAPQPTPEEFAAGVAAYAAQAEAIRRQYGLA